MTQKKIDNREDEYVIFSNLYIIRGPKATQVRGLQKERVWVVRLRGKKCSL